MIRAIPQMPPGQTPATRPTVGASGARPSDDQVREELTRILASSEFRSSKRSQDFLRFVVEHALHGNADILKERTIGIEVFGRPTSYDPSDDATVRVKAGEVRKRLGIYYTGQGAHDPLRIEMPSGTYVPTFHAFEVAPAQIPGTPAALATVALADPSANRVSWRARTLWAGAGAAAACLIALGYWAVSRPVPTALDQFWAPVLRGSTPVLVGAAYVPVWSLDLPPGQRAQATSKDFLELTDQFVGGGDLIATTRLASMLTRLRRPYQVRVGADVSFKDLRTDPAILVGYSYTRWSEISKQMRFFIDGSRDPVGITDNGKSTEWSLPNLPRDRRTPEDYAIVSRLFHPDTHAMLVELAGITQYGTDAASDLVTNPDLMADALRDAPQGWQQKNLQFVLHVKVISGAPASPRVVKSYYW
ncbi:MAG TPA: hypothetical protein VHW24_00390 [Bryobacteraceae bacterium]|nr:hypothetical protein [Bryobacteraceae bacterium]